MKPGFKKVYQYDDGKLAVAEFFNPTTGEEYCAVVRNVFYPDVNWDEEGLKAPLDMNAYSAWRSKRKIFCIGDRVRVVRGIKVPIGTVGIIRDMYDWKDERGRVKNKYVVLDNGYRTSYRNVVIV